MKIQKLTALALALALLLALAACGAPAAEPTAATEAPAEPTAESAPAAGEPAEAVTVRLAALTGPTAMGMAKIFSDADAGTAANDYEYALYGAADELTPQLLQGSVDIAAVPQITPLASNHTYTGTGPEKPLMSFVKGLLETITPLSPAATSQVAESFGVSDPSFPRFHDRMCRCR